MIYAEIEDGHFVEITFVTRTLYNTLNTHQHCRFHDGAWLIKKNGISKMKKNMLLVSTALKINDRKIYDDIEQNIDVGITGVEFTFT